ncbi:nitroreductase family protein [Pseudemcibacter aquimaris]|uniref:nitroreductase family protein n=1 Tax=Pseudemcibacter aquimaris TaxID=2857064 RepID=UPI002012D814|nr:nitroreductase [Pseudemcibacter aquimaris]MCC3862435.1 nitroreductase [Pseudemcibacter aquimaris]WDU59136.1 nitroreductase [Pseudemcibacter aquimaris]
MNKSAINSDRLPASNPCEEMLSILLRRRSLTVKDMTEPGPSDNEIATILTAGSRVPDHKKLVPWRFLTIQGGARADLGKTLRTVFHKNNPVADEELLNFEENRLMRAPLVIAVISTATEDNPKNVPEWEQILTAGAVCQNILLAANALGYAGQWLTEWYAFDEDILNELGLTQEERIAGFIYIGSATKDPAERGRPDVAAITQNWSATNK